MGHSTGMVTETAQVLWPLCLASLGLGGIGFTQKVWQATRSGKRRLIWQALLWGILLEWSVRPVRYRDRFARTQLPNLHIFLYHAPRILDERLASLGYGHISWQGIATGKQIYAMLRKSRIIKYHIIDLAYFSVTAGCHIWWFLKLYYYFHNNGRNWSSFEFAKRSKQGIKTILSYFYV